MERPVEIIDARGRFVLYSEDFLGDFKINCALLIAEALQAINRISTPKHGIKVVEATRKEKSASPPHW
jgi:hypothetical protein